MVLTLTVRNEMTIPLEVETLLPERLRDLRAAEIERLPVLFGNQTGSVGEYFHVSGEVVENQEMRFVGACENLKRIGEGMSQGRIVVEGSAGMHLGAEMHGGEILVTGNVSDWCGAELDGGTIRIRGNAADHLGGAYRGAKRGMTGGEILVEGNCGHEAGQGMRRGLIGVAGNVGDSVGYQMSGGTIRRACRGRIEAGNNRLVGGGGHASTPGDLSPIGQNSTCLSEDLSGTLATGGVPVAARLSGSGIPTILR